jgi:GNAT superfamily N-acetyltransferase
VDEKSRMSARLFAETAQVCTRMNDERFRAAIRRAVVTDAEEIARLSEQFGHPVAVQDLRLRIAMLRAMAGQYLAVAARPGHGLLGWIQVERRLILAGGERAEIVGLVVDAATRRCGVGRLLVNAAQEWARTLGIVAINVRSNVARDVSHHFYLGLGYSRFKTQHVYAKSMPD